MRDFTSNEANVYFATLVSLNNLFPGPLRQSCPPPSSSEKLDDAPALYRRRVKLRRLNNESHKKDHTQLC